MGNIRISIFSILLGSLAIGLWGLFFQAPVPIKFLFSISLYLCILFFPYSYLKDNDFDILSNILIISLLCWGVFEIGVTALNTNADMYSTGNKWIILMFNEYSSFIFLPPLFTYICSNIYNLNIIFKSVLFYLFISILISFINKSPAAFSPIFIVPFIPYLRTSKQRIMIIMVIIVSIIYAKADVRMLFLVNLYGIVALIICSNRYLSPLRWVACFFLLFIPFVIFIPILGLEKGELSFFQEVQNYLREHGFGGDSTDTRTFLYLEMAEDLTVSNSWIFGKGAYCHYYSSYFASSAGDIADRMNSEVPFLNFLLKGGIGYIVLYYSLLIWAIIKGLIKGKNKFVQIATIIISGWFLNTFIGDTNGCRFYHACVFFLVGCCISPSILSKKDSDIQLLFDNNYKKYILLKILVLQRLQRIIGKPHL